jgi:diguanylate cyclase (GGDEF)-like protein/PAS domain S-box-containing protein/putative nucleotidyltransferase with HDIG domain
MDCLMTAPRLTGSRAGARLSALISETPPSARRSALALFGCVLPCAIALALAVGHASGRPAVLGLAVALAVLQIAYLRYGSPGARAWGWLAVAAPLTLAVVTLAMSTEGDVLFPLLFTSVCWAALSLSSRQVAANVLVTIAVSALPVIARAVGWEDGNPAEGVGLLLVSATGYVLVGVVAHRLASALRRGRQVSEAVVGALRDGLVIVQDGRIARVNERMCEITGFSEDELVGCSTPLPYWPPESVEAIRAINEDVIRLGQGDYDVVLCRKNGERFPAIVTVGVTSGRDSRVVMIKDVAERAELVAETRAAREAFAHSAEVIGEYLYSGERKPDECFEMHARGRGLAALLGAPEETQELVDGYDDFLHPEDRPAFDVAWRFADLIQRDGEIVEQEYRLVGVDGVSRWVRDRAAVTVLDGRVLLTGAVRDISAQRQAEDERAEALRRLEFLSSVDALTELFNRRHFSEVLRARLAGSAADAAIALVDVDHFKRINDTHGHQIGDLVLREIARRLKDATRPCDVTSRWGGEEFCVLLDEIGDDAGLETLVERLRDSVGATPIPIGENGAVRVTISIGAVRPTAECHTPEQLLASADAALYTAKRGGRNQARIARGAPMLVPMEASDGLEGVVQALAAAASIRGGVGPMHCSEVAALSTAVAVELGLPAADVELARLGGWLHDCGKVTVPTDILAHRGPLDERARARVRHHAIAGEALVSVVPGLTGAAQVVRSHHERFDGAGYPDGLAGDEIPFAARIVAAADAFVAMTESRPYEGPRGHREAVAELQRSSGSQFDPRVVDALVAVLEHERRGDEARAS